MLEVWVVVVNLITWHGYFVREYVVFEPKVGHLHHNSLVLNVVCAFYLQLFIKHWKQSVFFILVFSVQLLLKQNLLSDVHYIHFVWFFLPLLGNPMDSINIYSNDLCTFRDDHDLEVLAKFLGPGMKILLLVYRSTWTNECLCVIQAHLASAHINWFWKNYFICSVVEHLNLKFSTIFVSLYSW